MSTKRNSLAGAGTQTAGLGFGGYPSPTGATEEYDGSTWTAGGCMGTAQYYGGGAGTQGAAVVFGSPVGLTQEYTKSPNNLYTKSLCGSL